MKLIIPLLVILLLVGCAPSQTERRRAEHGERDHRGDEHEK